ncbi:hypothetical protein DFH09DRAFT_1141497 [Mycena vulgaris]|nr:hypothetical protein DFH09DRAFT_1141497 [Mycena vulgaris]
MHRGTERHRDGCGGRETCGAHGGCGGGLRDGGAVCRLGLSCCRASGPPPYVDLPVLDCDPPPPYPYVKPESEPEVDAHTRAAPPHPSPPPPPSARVTARVHLQSLAARRCALLAMLCALGVGRSEPEQKRTIDLERRHGVRADCAAPRIPVVPIHQRRFEFAEALEDVLAVLRGVVLVTVYLGSENDKSKTVWVGNAREEGKRVNCKCTAVKFALCSALSSPRARTR